MCKGVCVVVAALIGIIVGVLSGLPTIWAVTLAILIFIFGYWALNRWLCGKGDVIAAAAPAPKPATEAPAAAAPAAEVVAAETSAQPAPPQDPAPEPEAATTSPTPEPAAHWSDAVAADSGKAGSARGQTGLKPSAALPEEETVRGDVGSWKYESDAAPYRAATPPPGPGAGGGYAPSAEAAPEPVSAPASAAAPAAAVEEQAPEVLTAARGGSADDLKRIKGVGPGLEKTLNEMGFYHFDQIAAWGPAEVAWVDARLKFKGRIERDSWIAQAAELAKG